MRQAPERRSTTSRLRLKSFSGTCHGHHIENIPSRKHTTFLMQHADILMHQDISGGRQTEVE
jgi:hypothetical protein